MSSGYGPEACAGSGPIRYVQFPPLGVALPGVTGDDEGKGREHALLV